MPVYNGRRYLNEAVDSILAQTFEDFEFVVVNDGSTDGSLEVLQEYARRDPRIRIISRPNTGLVGALNDGLAAARAKFIARMDADDVSLPDRLARQVDFMESHSDCVAAGSSYFVITSQGEVIGELAAETDAARISEMLIAGESALAHPTTIMRAESLRRVGGYRPEFAHAEDYDLWLRLDEIGQLGNLAETLFKHRWHFDSICQKERLTQSRHVVKANAEARRRRGLIDGAGDALPPLHGIAAERSRPEFLRICCTVALRHKAYQPALRFILSATAQEPLSRDNWRLIVRYLIGNRLADAMKRPFTGRRRVGAHDERSIFQVCGK